MSLIFYLVKRALARTFGNMPEPHQQPNPQNTSSSHDVVETIWAGMSVNQLRTTFGTPKSKQNSQGGEVWVYANLNGQGTETEITIENGMVAGWKDKVSSSSSLSPPLSH